MPQGNPLSITDAFGQPEAQTTTYEWQATTNLLLSVTDALTRKTAYTYNAKGNVLTVTLSRPPVRRAIQSRRTGLFHSHSRLARHVQ